MTTSITTVPDASTLQSRSRRRRRLAASAALWGVRVLLAAQFLAGGVLKLTADPSMVAMFADLGSGQALRLLVGTCEVAGALGLLVPRLARAAAVGLVLLMVGAAVANVAVLQISPLVPAVLAATATGVLVALTSTRTGREDAR